MVPKNIRLVQTVTQVTPILQSLAKRQKERSAELLLTSPTTGQTKLLIHLGIKDEKAQLYNNPHEDQKEKKMYGCILRP